MRRLSVASVLGLLASNAKAALEVIPAATWTATNTGEHIQAHGHGIIEVDGTYYMIGEDKTEGSAFQNVNCYSSTDLVEWAYEGALLSRTEEAGDLGPERVVERPKVMFNDNTGKYVLYLHIDSSDYKDARVGVATGDTVCGKYEYHGSSRPLGFQSRDIGIFKDSDGAGYLLTEDRDYGTRIIAMTDDYLNVTEVTFGWEYFAESPAMLKMDGHYFLFGSHLTGWDPNDNVYTHATSLSGPWSEWTEFAPVGSNTHKSQVSYILPLGTDNAIYIGDRWVKDNLAASTYIWLPLTISGTDVSLDWQDRWAPDVASGTWSTPSDTARVEGESGDLINGARVISCSECSGSEAAGYIGGDEGGTVSFNGVPGSGTSRATIGVKYRNGDTAARHATVTVNDLSYDIAFLSTQHRSDITHTSSLHCDLKEGENTISISTDGGWGPDVDEIVLPVW